MSSNIVVVCKSPRNHTSVVILADKTVEKPCNVSLIEVENNRTILSNCYGYKVQHTQ